MAWSQTWAHLPSSLGASASSPGKGHHTQGLLETGHEAPALPSLARSRLNSCSCCFLRGLGGSERAGPLGVTAATGPVPRRPCTWVGMPRGHHLQILNNFLPERVFCWDHDVGPSPTQPARPPLLPSAPGAGPDGRRVGLGTARPAVTLQSPCRYPCAQARVRPTASKSSVLGGERLRKERGSL